MNILKLYILCLFWIFKTTLSLNCSNENYQLFSNGKCYRVHLTASVAHSQAELTCQQDGAILPIVKRPSDNSVLTLISMNHTMDFWLGLTCASNDDCTWQDGSRYSIDDYDGFSGGEANVANGHCVILRPPRGYWDSIDCELQSKGIVCEMDVGAPFTSTPSNSLTSTTTSKPHPITTTNSSPQNTPVSSTASTLATSTTSLPATTPSTSATTSSSPTSTTTAGGKPCREQWTYYDVTDLCYRYFNESRRWDVSVQTCREQQAELVTIHNAFENNKVIDIVNEAQAFRRAAVWIGLHRVLRDDWGWIDGSTAAFRDWIVTDTTTVGDCVSLRGEGTTSDPAGWYNSVCEILQPFVCYYRANKTRL